MAITGIEKDKLAELLNQDKTSRRFDNWLWLFLSTNGRSEEVKRYGPGNKEWIVNALSQDPLIKDEVLTQKDKTFLPEEHLKWITRDTRQGEWLNLYLSNIVPPALIPPFLIGRDRIVALIDVAKIDLEAKAGQVEITRSAWNQYLKKDRVFDWFKKEDEGARRSFAWEWMRASNPDLIRNWTSFGNHQELLLFFFRALLYEDAKILIVEKIKKAWGQKKYRENLKDKRQCNLVLSNESIKLLDQLGKKYDLTRAELFEILIKMEAKNETYLTEKLRNRQTLLS